MIATGVVIGKNTVLTNKHVADNNNANLSFAPAAENENSFPYGTFKAKEVIAYPGDADLVVIHFNKNSEGQSVGDVVTPATIGESTTVSSNEPITVTGYPGDKPLATMWESSGKVKSNNDNILTYSASTFGGNSGSPVFNDNNELIGLHYGGVEGESNNAVAITGEVLEFIKNTMFKQLLYSNILSPRDNKVMITDGLTRGECLQNNYFHCLNSLYVNYFLF